jgi:hypothetical protein
MIFLAGLLVISALFPAARAQAQGPRLVLAFYYSWFDENTWTSAKVPDFPAQTYVSRDPTAMDRHIAQAQSAGIDALVVSWYGPWGGANNQTESNFASMLDVANSRGFKLALDVEATSPFAGGSGSMVEMLRHALSVHANHPAYLRVDGKPVLFFWRQQRFSPGTWQSIRDQVDPGRTSIWIAEGVDMSYQSVFDGHHLYTVTWNPPTDPSATANKFSRWVQQARERYGSYRYWVATAMPGYNDTRTGRGNAFARSREDGAYYAQTWQAAIASNPDWVIVTSFNEWPEGTYIEPSQAYGDRYLQLTAEWSNRFKSGEASPPAPAPTEGQASAGSPAEADASLTSSPSKGEVGRESPPAPPYAALLVQTPVLNMRRDPGTASPVVAQAVAGSVWRATGRLASGSWWQVCCIEGRRAWVFGELVQPIGPADQVDRVRVVEPVAASRNLVVD